MKVQIFTYLVLPFYLFSAMAQADTQQKVSVRKAQVKHAAAAVCAALLTVATTSAVVASKMSNHNPMQGWATRNRLYRDKHSLAVFLGRGLGKKFFNEDMEISDADIEVVESYDSFFDEVDVVKVIYSTDEETLNRSIFFSERNANGYLKGYIVLPGLVSRFEVLPLNEDTNKREFILRALGNNAVLARGYLNDLIKIRQNMAEIAKH